MLAKLYGDPKFDDRFFQDLGLTEIDNNVLLNSGTRVV